jgi:hypothetical protein
MEFNFAVLKASKLAFKESSVLVIMPDNSAVSVNAVALYLQDRPAVAAAIQRNSIIDVALHSATSCEHVVYLFMIHTTQLSIAESGL